MQIEIIVYDDCTKTTKVLEHKTNIEILIGKVKGNICSWHYLNEKSRKNNKYLNEIFQYDKHLVQELKIIFQNF